MTAEQVCLYVLTRPWWLRLLLAPVLWYSRRMVLRRAVRAGDGMERLPWLLAALEARRERGAR